MKTIHTAIMLCTAISLGSCRSQTADALHGIRRIVVLGDSITQDGNWVADVECGLLSQGMAVDVIDIGLGSETASDLTAEENAGHATKYGFPRPAVGERLERALAATRPDLVLACYGMNDGSSLPGSEDGTARYATAITRLRESALRAGAVQVVLCTPPIRECPAGTWDANHHDQNLQRYTAWLNGKKTDGWQVVDIHTPMRAALEEHRRTDPGYCFSKDSVHPGREGHWVMASAVLGQWLGVDTTGKSRAEDLFPANGDRIRTLVRERQAIRFAAYMTAIGHHRPGVSGGPKAKPGMPVDTAETLASKIGADIAALLASP